MSAHLRRKIVSLMLCLFILTAFSVLLNSEALAQFEWRPAYYPPYYDYDGNPSTINPGSARDSNPSTYSTTYTNADFDGPGTPPPPANFTQTALWSYFRKPYVYLTNFWLHAQVDGGDNLQDANGQNQWKIEYYDGSDWHEMVQFTITYSTLDDSMLAVDDVIEYTAPSPSTVNDTAHIIQVTPGGTSGTIVLERYENGEFINWEINGTITTVGGFSGTITGFTIDPNPTPAITLRAPLTLATADDTQVRIRTKQINTSIAQLSTYEVWISADWDTETGGAEPLRITTTSLPHANKYSSYDQYVQVIGGIPPYSWEIVPGSGELPQYFTSNPTPAPDYDSWRIQYPGPPPYAISGTYNFTLEVTDQSTPQQTDRQALTLVVEGLSITPPGPNLPPAKKNQAYETSGLEFTPSGGNGTYYWCYSGSLPTGMDLHMNSPTGGSVPPCAGGEPTPIGEALSLWLTGTPALDGSYSFNISLKDTSGEPTVTYNYVLNVGASGVTLEPKELKGYVKGIPYGPNATDMAPEFVVVRGIDTSGGDGTIRDFPSNLLTLPINNLSIDSITPEKPPAIEGVIPASRVGTLRVDIVGTVGMTVPSGIHTFTLEANDPGNINGQMDRETYQLNVLERKTILVQAPPSTVTLPSDSQLLFVVSAEGGAPSNGLTDSALAGKSVPYYDYNWVVTPVGNAPALAAANATGTTTPITAAAENIPITFEQPDGAPATGTYDIIFWAQDYLTRTNSTNPNYKFTPATVRIKVIAPGGRTLERETGGKMKLRQEQFR